LLALAVGAFAIGTTEFVVVGLLPVIGDDLSVSVATAGALVTGYAIGVAVGGPLLTHFVRDRDRRTILWRLMALFALGHLILAIAPSFEVLLVARIVTAAAHGAFFGVGAVGAAQVAGPGKEGRAISIMFTGLTAATVLGVPFGTFIGEQTSWRVPFLVVAVLAGAAAVAVRASDWRPRSTDGAPVAVQAARGVADKRRLALALATTIIGWGGQFVPFTFLADYLQRETGVSASAVSVLLLVFGIAAALGAMLGGRAYDRWERATLPIAFVALAAVLLAFGLGASAPWVAVPLLFLWGIPGFVIVPALQSRVVTVAGPGSPLASALNIAAFNVGIAAGSIIGSVLVNHGHLALTPYVAAGLALVAVIPAMVGATAAPRRERAAVA
jgi:DHA1 family inner membrane transport protein